MIYYRIRNGKVGSDDIVYTSFAAQGDEFYIGDSANAMIFGDTDPELYFFDEPISDVVTHTHQHTLDEQRICFNEKLETVETAELNVEPSFLSNDVKVLNFIDLNKQLTTGMLDKVQLIADNS